MPGNIAQRVGEIVPPAVQTTMRAARQKEAGGATLTYLMRGEPDFTTPAHICEAGADALRAGHTQYPPIQGLPELRRAIAARMERDFQMLLDPDTEVLVTTGATSGIYIAIHALVDPGDEVILLDPCYDPYAAVVHMAGGVVVRVPCVPEAGHFAIPISALDAAVTGRTKAILINNPWNPTGSVMTAAELDAIAGLAEAYHLVLISDEIYENITFDGRHHVCLAARSPRARERSVIINSFSKTYAMTGWRLGYSIAPPEITRAMLGITEQLSRSAPPFVQFAGVAALCSSQDEPRAMVRAYEERRRILSNALVAGGIATFHPPEGTFFLFLDVRSYQMDSGAMARYLLDAAGLVTVPGSAYGPAGAGYIRLSFAYDEDTLRRGAGLLVGALNRL